MAKLSEVEPRWNMGFGTRSKGDKKEDQHAVLYDKGKKINMKEENRASGSQSSYGSGHG